jgi:hypothetical protein
MVVHIYNSSNGKLRQEDCEFKGQPGLYSEFQDSLGYITTPCLQEKRREERRKGEERSGGRRRGEEGGRRRGEEGRWERRGREGRGEGREEFELRSLCPLGRYFIT